MELINLKEHFENSYLEKDIFECDDELRDRIIASYDSEIVSNVIDAISDKICMDKEFKDITFGQMVIIEQILTSGKSEHERISEALATFYRPVCENVFSNADKASNEAHLSLFSTMAAGVALKLFDSMILQRKEFFYERFANIIYSNTQVQKNENDIEQNNSLETVFYKTFGWYERQKLICKELNMKMSEVLNITAEEALVELTYQHYKNKLEMQKKHNRR